MSALEILTEKLKDGSFFRIVALGSSNTERRVPGMNWFDCLELAVRGTYGRHCAFINSGYSGDTTFDLLNRFDRDCLSLQPKVVILTVGGNDSNPDRNVPVERYRENLSTVLRRLRDIGCEAVLQTYYAPDVAGMSATHMAAFDRYMEVIRETSREVGCLLVDHLTRWEPLRDRCYGVYKSLMKDPMHTNELGNTVLGLDVVRAFALSLPDDAYYREARSVQALMDELSPGSVR